MLVFYPSPSLINVLNIDKKREMTEGLKKRPFKIMKGLYILFKNNN